MSPEQIGELIRSLGIAAPLVGLLYVLLRQATDERREITDRFLLALETSVNTSATAQKETTAALKDLSNDMIANRRANAEEHKRVIETIAKLHNREAA